MSHQNADTSSDISGSFIEYVVKLFAPEISENDLSVTVESLQFFVRKAAHFSVYTFLGILSFLHISTYKALSVKGCAFISLAVSALYSVSDEYHQTFISGRSGELRDVLIDTAGALTGIIISLIIYKIYKTIKHKDKKKMKKKDYMELVKNLERRLTDGRENEENLTAENSRLKKKNSDLNIQLEELRRRICDLEEEQVPEERIEKTAEPEVFEEKKALPQSEEPKEPTLSVGIELGAKIIGKIVLSSAEYCNRLTEIGAAANAKELVNLILGRTEVAKGEILRLSQSELDGEEMLAAMEREYNEAEDYFKSVMAQKN